MAEHTGKSIWDEMPADWAVTEGANTTTPISVSQVEEPYCVPRPAAEEAAKDLLLLHTDNDSVQPLNADASDKPMVRPKSKKREQKKKQKEFEKKSKGQSLG